MDKIVYNANSIQRVSLHDWEDLSILDVLRGYSVLYTDSIEYPSLFFNRKKVLKLKKGLGFYRVYIGGDIQFMGYTPEDLTEYNKTYSARKTEDGSYIVFRKPFVKVMFADKDSNVEWFDSTEEAEEFFNKLISLDGVVPFEFEDLRKKKEA